MSGFKEFVLISMALDLILVVALCYLLGKRLPGLLVFLVVCNILPYFFVLPLTEIPGMKSRGNDTPGYFELADIARRPENIVGKNNIPPPRFQIPALFKAFQPPAAGAGTEEQVLQENTPSNDPFLVRWQKALRSDPYALWIFIRIFWTAAALVVYFEWPVLGACLAGVQLLPLPSLIYAVSYGALYLVSLPVFATVGRSLKDPSEIWDHLAPRFYSALASVGGLLLVVGMVILMVLASRRLAPKRLLAKVYLDPKKYWVKLNGSVHTFEVKGSRLLIEDISFDCRNIVAVDPDNPHIWRLGTNTFLEFVKKNPDIPGRPGNHKPFRGRH